MIEGSLYPLGADTLSLRKCAHELHSNETVTKAVHHAAKRVSDTAQVGGLLIGKQPLRRVPTRCARQWMHCVERKAKIE